MKAILETLDNWASGVITTLQAHTLEPSAMPRLWNGVLKGAGEGKAIVAKRWGLRMRNSTPLTGSPAILAHIDFRRASGVTLTGYHLLVSDGGRLDKLLADDTTAAADNVTPAPFTAGTKRPDWAVAKNFLYIVNGTDAKKFDGTTVWNFSMAAPPAAPTLADSGVAGTPNGTYEGALLYYNSNTGFYSSAGPANSITVASKQIDFSWTAPTDPQVTHVIPLIRNTANQPNFYHATTPIAVGTTTYRFNTDTTLLVTKAPDQDENDPLPSGVTNIEPHNERIFATDGAQLYYSKSGQFEAFDPDAVELVGKNDGQLIVALHSTSAGLLIFKQRSVYILVGVDPEDWRVELLDSSIGTVSHLSIVSQNGIDYWWAEGGPVAFSGGAIAPIGKLKIGPTVSSSNLNLDALDSVSAAVDSENDLILWAVPELGGTRNTLIIPFNYVAGVFVGDRWDPMDASCLGTVRNLDDSVPHAYIGGYAGQVFKFDTGVGNDGLPSGSTDSGNVSSATSSTLTDADATFTTTGGKLIERYVWAIDPAGTRVQRRRITDNTATELTITPNWSTTPSSEWTYVVAGPDFQMDTRWNFGGAPFVKKRFMFLHLLATSMNGGVEVNINLFLDANLAATAPDKTLTATLTSDTAKFDAGAKWDVSKWAGSLPYREIRKRMAKTGTTWRARIMNRNPDEDVQILMLAMESELLSSKRS